jgi:hypothetical protein
VFGSYIVGLRTIDCVVHLARLWAYATVVLQQKVLSAINVGKIDCRVPARVRSSQVAYLHTPAHAHCPLWWHALRDLNQSHGQQAGPGTEESRCQVEVTV